MLVVVLANNLLFLFIGWELVGLSSYLLIGFWYDREPRRGVHLAGRRGSPPRRPSSPRASATSAS